MKKFYNLLLLILWLPVIGQQTPANPQEQSILITNAMLHLGNGTTLEKGALGFKNGIITFVGAQADETDYEQIIDAEGTHLYPGFIALNASLGLAEIDAVRATRDDDELGDFLPHVRAAIAYDAESK